MSQFGSHGHGNPSVRATLGALSQSSGPAHIPAPAKLPHPPSTDETSSIGLINDAELGTSEHKIKAIGGGDLGLRKEQFKRKTAVTGQGACRCRSFHGRLSSQGLDYLDNQINEWLDSHPDVEVKFVTSTVGTFEGKIREPALVLNLWY